MKIDVEGTEHTVLEGAVRVLQEHRPFLVCEILRGRVEKGVHAVLDRLDYEYFWITRRALVRRTEIVGGSPYGYSNYVFLPREKTDVLTGVASILEGHTTGPLPM